MPVTIKIYALLKRIRAISFLLIFIDLKNLPFEVEKKKRIKAVKAVTFLYRVYKGYRGRNRYQTRSAVILNVKKNKFSSPAKPAMLTPLIYKPLQYSFYFYNIRADWHTRVKKYTKINIFKKYFERYYFKRYLKGMPIACPEYKFIYDYKNYLRNYKGGYGILI